MNIFYRFLIIASLLLPTTAMAVYAPPAGSPMANGDRPRLWFSDAALRANVIANALDDVNEVEPGVTFKAFYDQLVARDASLTTNPLPSTQALVGTVITQAVLAVSGNTAAKAALITRMGVIADYWKSITIIDTSTGQATYAVTGTVSTSGTREMLIMLFALDAVYSDMTTAQKKNVAESLYYMGSAMRVGAGGEAYNLAYSNRLHSHLILNTLAAMFYGETSFSLDVDTDFDGLGDTETVLISDWVSLLLDGDGVNSGLGYKEAADGNYPLIQHRLDVIKNYDSWPEGTGYMMGENAYNPLLLMGFFAAEGRDSSYYSDFWWKNFAKYVWKMSSPGDFRLDKFTDQTNTSLINDAGYGFCWLPSLFGWLYPSEEGTFNYLFDFVGYEYPASSSYISDPFTLMFRRAGVAADTTRPTDFTYNNTGYYNLRTGYNTTDTSLTVVGMDYCAGHQGFGKNGHIDLYHKGKLLITSAHYDSSSFGIGIGPYQKKTHAYNTILMYYDDYDQRDWTQSVTEANYEYGNTGSQMIPTGTRRENYEDTWFDAGDLVYGDTLDNVTHNPPSYSAGNGNGYDYINMDYTASYAPEISSEVTREIISNLDDGWMFVFDRVRNESGLAALPKRALWHCNEEPILKQSDGSIATGTGTVNAFGGTAKWDSTNTSWVEFVDNGANVWNTGTGGKLFINTVIPTSATIRVVGGPDDTGTYWSDTGYEFYDPDFGQAGVANFAPRDTDVDGNYEIGWGRIETYQSTPAQQEYFLTAFQIGDTGDSHIVVENITAIDSDFYGAIAQDTIKHVALFSKSSVKQSTTAYTVTATGTVKHVVSNMTAGEYSATQDTLEIAAPTVLTDGTLYFVSTDGGAFAVTLTDETPEVPVEPTCSDGIQNADETGIDCGGSCEACEIPPVDPTCSDGIQNGDETGIDCGGSCEACSPAPAPTAHCGVGMFGGTISKLIP